MALAPLAPTSYEVPPAGWHPAHLVAVIELGTHEKINTLDGSKWQSHDIYLVWELVSCPDKGKPGKNMLLGTRVAYSLGPKSVFRKLVCAWLGKADFAEHERLDPRELFHAPCQVNVLHEEGNKGQTLSKFSGIKPLAFGELAPPALRKPLLWEIETGRIEDLAGLPFDFGRNVQDVVRSSQEYKGSPAAKPAPAVGNGARSTSSTPRQPQPSLPDTAESNLPF